MKSGFFFFCTRDSTVYNIYDMNSWCEAFHAERSGPSLDIRRRSKSRGRPVRQIVLGTAVLRHSAVHQSQQGPRVIRHRRTPTTVLDCSNTVLRQEKRYLLSFRPSRYSHTRVCTKRARTLKKKKKNITTPSP